MINHVQDMQNKVLNYLFLLVVQIPRNTFLPAIYLIFLCCSNFVSSRAERPAKHQMNKEAKVSRSKATRKWMETRKII